jgi:hypothetical protein
MSLLPVVAFNHTELHDDFMKACEPFDTKRVKPKFLQKFLELSVNMSGKTLIAEK